MSQIVPFKFEENAVRVANRDGSPWFVLADICRVLEIRNSRDAAARLDDDEKDGVGITDAIGRPQEATIINESGLWSLVLTSRKPEAKRFKKWITSEVIPTIRRTGRYEAAGSVSPKPVPVMTDKLREASLDDLLRIGALIGDTLGKQALQKVLAPLCGVTMPQAPRTRDPLPPEWLQRGLRLRALRRQANLTQPELAMLTGICVNNISRFERGVRDMTMEQVGTLAKAFSATPAFLIDGESQSEKHRKDSG